MAYSSYGHFHLVQKGSPCVQTPKNLLSKCRLVHLLAGIPKQVPGMPLSDVLLVNVKMLTLSELNFLSGKVRCSML